MNKQDKPRICAVLGVDVGERFEFVNSCGYKYTNVAVDRSGHISYEQLGYQKELSGNNVCYLINHPECIVRRKRFTPHEIEDAKAIRRVVKCMNTIRRLAGGELWLETKDSDMHISMSFGFPGNDSAFPSIAPGESYTLDEIIGEGSE